MKFTSENKKAIDALVPLGISGGLFYYLYTKGKSWKEIIWLPVAALVLSWLIVKQFTKAALTAAEAPDHVNVDPDAAGQIDQDFNPQPYTDRLKDDIYSWGWRDSSIYSDLVLLSNANLVKVYNDWTERYFSEDNETMIEAMEGETYGNWTSTAHNTAAIINRLKGMGLS
jgi:hypothetical protein